MARKRTPPLFEVLSGPARRAGPAGYVGQRAPIEVHIPPNARMAADPGESRWGTRNIVGVISIIVAVIFVVVLGIWFAAFHLGQRQQKDEQAKLIDPYLSPNAPSPTTVIPAVKPPPSIPTQPSTDGTAAAPDPKTTPNTEPITLSLDPRKSGNNYLHIVTLSWKDADRAAEYLTKNGIPAIATPAGAAKAVDPSEARAKNLPHLVFALEAIPSDQYKATERKRQEMVDRVRRIGKKWQSEEKGPSDFGEPGWVKFK